MTVVEPRDDWNPGTHYFPSGLEFDGCACTEGTVDGTFIDAHCHRTNRYEDDGSCCDCQHAGVHYSGNRDVALRVADYIANAYRCGVALCAIEELPTCHGTGVK